MTRSWDNGCWAEKNNRCPFLWQSPTSNKIFLGSRTCKPNKNVGLLVGCQLVEGCVLGSPYSLSITCAFLMPLRISANTTPPFGDTCSLIHLARQSNTNLKATVPGSYSRVLRPRRTRSTVCSEGCCTYTLFFGVLREPNV